jgi:general secretion pathway protein L
VSRSYGCRTGPHDVGKQADAEGARGRAEVRLRVWLPPFAELGPDSALPFEVLDTQRRVQRRGEAVAGALPRGMDCEVVLDAGDVLLVETRLPRLSGGRLAAALPGLVEECVAGDVERCHVTASPPDADGQAAVAVVDRALLRRTLEILQRAGQRVVHVTPQPLALGMTPGNWRARLRAGQGSVRTGSRTGASFGAGSPPLELHLLLGQAPRRPIAIEVDGECDASTWSEALGIDVVASPPDSVAPPVALDLMQYEFARSVLPWRAWRTTAALAAALLLVALGSLNLHAWLLRAQEQALRAEMVRIVQEANPQVPVVLDPLAQMRRHVSDLRAGAGTDTEGFVALAAGVARFAAADSVQAMQYRSGQLAVRLRAPLAEADPQRKALVDRAAAAGLLVTVSGETMQVTRRAAP